MDDDDAPEGEVELQRASALFLVELERVAELERTKRAMRPDDPGRPALARQVEDVTIDRA